jgi:hypothetical protein
VGKVDRLRKRQIDDEAGARKAAELKARFRAISAKRGLAPKRRPPTIGQLAPLLAFILTVVGFGYASYLADRFGSWANVWPHLNAASNCAAVRSYGLAPAPRGAPGYWPWHDRDKDGIACEPWPR